MLLLGKPELFSENGRSSDTYVSQLSQQYLTLWRKSLGQSLWVWIPLLHDSHHKEYAEELRLLVERGSYRYKNIIDTLMKGWDHSWAKNDLLLR